MKKMKLAVVFAALVSVFGFSSCLDSGESQPQPIGLFVNVESGYLGTKTFIPDVDPKVTLTPTTASLSLSGLKDEAKRALIYYTVPEGQNLENTKNLTIELVANSCQASPISYISNRMDTLSEYTSPIYAFADDRSAAFVNGRYLLVNCQYYANKLSKVGMAVNRVSQDTIYLDIKMKTEGYSNAIYSYNFAQTHYDLRSLANCIDVEQVEAKEDSVCLTVRALTSQNGERMDSVTTKVKYSTILY